MAGRYARAASLVEDPKQERRYCQLAARAHLVAGHLAAAAATYEELVAESPDEVGHLRIPMYLGC